MSHYSDTRLTCTFYTRIGACRHGEKCSRKHIKPTSSNVILLSNLYQNPKLNKNNDTEELNQRQLQEYFDHFYKDVFVKLAEFGEIIAMVVCENDNNHLNGNVYVKFTNDVSSYNSVVNLNQEWFAGRPVHCELSPVENFADANCRAYDTSSCNRGDHCNFMHVRRPSQALKMSLFKSQEKSIIIKKLKELTDQSDSIQPSDGLPQNIAETPETSTKSPQQPANDSPMDSTNSTVTTSLVEKLFS